MFNAVVLVATGVNNERHREVLGIKVATAGDYTGWREETGRPRTWPDDFFDPDTDWRPDTQAHQN